MITPRAFFRPTLQLFACVAFLFASAPAGAQEDAPDRATKERFSIGLSLFHSFSSAGYVRVREFNLAGDRLSLSPDLGLRSVNALSLEGTLPVSRRGALRAVFQATLFGGDAILPKDEWFNGTLYAGGGHVDIGSTQYYRGLILYQHRILGTPEPRNGRLSLEGGLVIDALDFHIDGPLSPRTVKTEKRENFARQLFPMPMIGVMARNPIHGDLGAYGEVRVAFMRDLPTFYKEGGTMSFTQTDLDTILGLSYRLDVVELHLAYRQSFFFQRTESHEDTNEFQLLTQGAELGATWQPR